MKILRAEVVKMNDSGYEINLHESTSKKCNALEKAAEWALAFLNATGTNFKIKHKPEQYEYMIISENGCDHARGCCGGDFTICDTVELAIRTTLYNFHPCLVAHFTGCKQSGHKVCALVLSFI